MQISEYKEVDFDKYCKLCKFKNKLGHEDPCNDCLTCPVRTNTCKPINFMEESL